MLTVLPNTEQDTLEHLPTWDGSTHACGKYLSMLPASIGYPRHQGVTKGPILLILNRLSVIGHCLESRHQRGFCHLETQKNYSLFTILVKRQIQLHYQRSMYGDV